MRLWRRCLEFGTSGIPDPTEDEVIAGVAVGLAVLLLAVLLYYLLGSGGAVQSLYAAQPLACQGNILKEIIKQK